MKKILLIGGGGHCASVADTLLRTNEYDLIGIVDKAEIPAVFGCIPYVGGDDDLPRLFLEGFQYAFVTVGSVGNTDLREKLYSLIRGIGFAVPNIIDPSAEISKFSEIGSGIFVGKNAVINANASVGDCAIINTSAVVEHDCRVEPFSHISPSAVLCGSVRVGFGTHIGAGSVVRQNISIGERSIIGIGSVVTGDIPSGVVAYGNPCREVRKA